MNGVAGGGGSGGVERERSRLDLARQHSEDAARAYRRARLAASRGGSASAPLRASRADLLEKRAALAAEVERVGRLACTSLEAAAALAVAFRAAHEALAKTDLLTPRGKVRRRPRAIRL
jgi:hypothetical protein